MLDREGVDRAVDLALVGDESMVRAGIEAYRAAGATTFAAQFWGTPGERAAGRSLLETMAGEGVPRVESCAP
jgi:alkanesulfonate monooxygenase SsuD/methylene tetrahydromethanopterin reductase-like flavin-dependent oxidoreductase (luciferase family)